MKSTYTANINKTQTDFVNSKTKNKNYGKKLSQVELNGTRLNRNPMNKNAENARMLKMMEYAARANSNFTLARLLKRARKNKTFH